MIVEILGPAGAGKTTLVTALCRTEPGIVTTVPITAIERASALWAALRPVLPYCVRHPRAPGSGASVGETPTPV
jgi:ABC-type hemin transport system ATPase subunit